MRSRQLASGLRPRATRDAVIVYHALGHVARRSPQWNGFVRPERFAEQMAYLAEHRRVVDLETLIDSGASTGPRRVAITFDDGYRSALEHAVPVLEHHSFPATFFVPTKWIGEWNGWSTRDLRLELMSADELVELERRGFRVESHGHAHVDYARVGAADARKDVRRSVDTLADVLGRAPAFLAYPYGTATPDAADEASRLGLRAAFTLDRAEAVSGVYALRRVSIVPADGRTLFALKSGGRYVGWRQSRPVRSAYRALRPLVRNRWLWP